MAHGRDLFWYIYVLKNTVDNKEYVGSTKHRKEGGSVQASLNKRFIQHRKDTENRGDRTKVYIHFRQIGFNNVYIELVEEINAVQRFGPNLTAQEYKRKVLEVERFHMESRHAELNTIPPIVSSEEKKARKKNYKQQWRQENQERLRTQNREYYQREDVQQHRQEYFQRENVRAREQARDHARAICPHCSCEVNKRCLPRHIKNRHSNPQIHEEV